MKIQPNSNFHTVSATSVFDGKMDDSRFKEYRRRWFENPAKFEAGTFPIHLDIESTSACNLRCPFCASTADNWGPKAPGFMDYDLFRSIIDEGCANGLFSIKLSLRGEPLLHKRLPDMVRYAKEKGLVDVYFNTNASLLTEDVAGALMDAGLDRISISFEGTTKAVYEKYRVGADFDAVVANVRRLRELRDRRRSQMKIRIQTVLLPELKAGFEDYVGFWSRICDEVSYLDAREEVTKDPHCGSSAAECASSGKDWACPFLWQRMMILWDGNVFPCLMHGISDMGELNLGKVPGGSLREMWNGSLASRVRDLHRAGRSGELKSCRSCSYRAMELEKGQRP